MVERYLVCPTHRLTGINAYLASPFDEWARVQELRKDKNGLTAGSRRNKPTDNSHICVSRGRCGLRPENYGRDSSPRGSRGQS